MKKKWFFVILIVVIVAVVLAIVFINLFKERTTKALSEKLVAVTETGYLAEDSDENKAIDEYLAYLKTLDGEFSETPAVDQKEVAKISNYLEAYASYEIATSFFAREMIFADATETYTNNRKKIENDFNKAQKKADEIHKYIEENTNKIGDSKYWAAQTWSDLHLQMRDLINYTADAVTRLAQVYRESVPMHVEGHGFMNNALSDIIFDEMKEMTQNITEKADADATYGHKLYAFVSAYLSKDKEHIILEYVYSEDLQNKANDIKEKWDASEFFASFVNGELYSFGN